MKNKQNHIAPEFRTVISLQPAERAAELEKALKDTDISFWNMPMIRTKVVALNPEIISTLSRLESVDLLVFTSRNGVKAFFQLLQQTGKKLSLNTKTAVIGKGTAMELERAYREADFVQPGNTSRDFADYLKNQVLRSGENILLVLGNLAPDFLQKELSPLVSVQRVDVYHTLPVQEYDTAIMQKIRDDQYGLLVFSSPSAFANFYGYFQKEASKVLLRIVSIGETTTRAILSTTKANVFTATVPGTDGLLNEIQKYFKH